MENLRPVLSATLIASALTGTLIALTDQYLWFAAPSHAYGLIAFVAIDLSLAAVLWRKTWLASLLAIGLAIIQATAMLADILTYSTTDVTQQAFRGYLLNNPEFVALLAIQPIILILGLGTSNIRIEYLMVRHWITAHLPR